MTLLVLAAAFLTSFAQASHTGRLVGHVDIGPLTPVERPGQKVKVPPELYRALTVQITQPGPHNGQMSSHLLRMVANLKLSSTGDFAKDLAPGEYRIQLSSERPSFRLPAPQTVQIRPGKTTRIEFKVDTGIR